jgi:hypothetical protein
MAISPTGSLHIIKAVGRTELCFSKLTGLYRPLCVVPNYVYMSWIGLERSRLGPIATTHIYND